MAAVVLLCPALSRADGAKNFAEWRDKAQPVESLSQFLSDFIGSCDASVLDKKECVAKVEAFRKQALGRAYYVILGEDAQKMVAPKGFNPQTHEQEFALTPFFEGSGFALTAGQPSHVDSEGHPIVPLMRMTTKFNESITHEKIEHEFSTGEVKVQLVFRPKAVWKLPRKDKKGAFYEGVKADFLAIRLSDARSGTELASLVTASK
jgi:hypothetical protein